MADIVDTFADSAILARVIAPIDGGMTPEVASELAKMRFQQDDLDRMNELSEKNRQGLATTADLQEIEAYARIGNLLNLLQSKARRSLSNE